MRNCTEHYQELASFNIIWITLPYCNVTSNIEYKSYLLYNYTKHYEILYYYIQKIRWSKRYDSSYWNPGFHSYLKILGTIVTYFFKIYIEMLVIRMSINSNSSMNYIYIHFIQQNAVHESRWGSGWHLIIHTRKHLSRTVIPTKSLTTLKLNYWLQC